MAGGKIYAIGGYGCGSQTAVNEIYNVATNSWTSGAQPPGGHAHHWGAFEEVGGKFYLMGGCQDASTCNSPQVHVYDPSTDTWASRTPVPHPLYASVHAAIGGKIYVAAGYNHLPSVSTWSFDTYVYDPQADSWTKLANFPGTQVEHAAGVALGGKLHFFGGHGGSADPYQSVHWVFDPTTNTWARAESLGWGAYGTTAVTVGVRAFVLGGWTAAGALTNFAEYTSGLYIYKK
jgi:N-acetylneuraminic acid mutarotase